MQQQREDRLVYVPGIPFDSPDSEVVALFSTVGPVESFRRVNRGFGFLEFVHVRDCERALAKAQFELRGRPFTIEKARGYSDKKKKEAEPAAGGNTTSEVAEDEKIKNGAKVAAQKNNKKKDARVTFYLQNVHHDAPTSRVVDVLERELGPVAEIRRVKPKDPFAFVHFADSDEALRRMAGGDLDLVVMGRAMQIRISEPKKKKSPQQPHHPPQQQPQQQQQQTTFGSNPVPEVSSLFDQQHLLFPAQSVAEIEASCVALIKEALARGVDALSELEQMCRRHGTVLAKKYGTFRTFVLSQKDLVIQDERVMVVEMPETKKKPAKKALVQCESCFGENFEDYKFCGMCGKKRGPPTCVACHAENLPSFVFCNFCGFKRFQ